MDYGAYDKFYQSVVRKEINCENILKFIELYKELEISSNKDFINVEDAYNLFSFDGTINHASQEYLIDHRKKEKYKILISSLKKLLDKIIMSKIQGKYEIHVEHIDDEVRRIKVMVEELDQC